MNAHEIINIYRNALPARCWVWFDPLSFENKARIAGLIR